MPRSGTRQAAALRTKQRFVSDFGAIPVQTILYNSVYIPPEWIVAHGFAPCRLTPQAPAQTTRSYDGCCSWARAFVEQASTSKSVAAVVVATICDQMRRASEWLSGDAPAPGGAPECAAASAAGSCPPVMLLHVPATWQTAAAQRYYRDELCRLGDLLARLGGVAPNPGRLAQVMLDYEQRREALRNGLNDMSGRQGAAAMADFHGDRNDHNEPPITAAAAKAACESAPTDVPLALLGDELRRIAQALEHLSGQRLDEPRLRQAIARANAVRRTLAELRRLAYTADPCPLPALEMLIAEMLAIHFCSDQAEALAVLHDLLAEVRRRVRAGVGVLAKGAVRVFWVNPVADLQVMNLLEQAGGRIGGADYMFCHALEEIPQDIEPFEALARMALGDPMVGPATDRGRHICRQIQTFASEAVVISRILGASHCPFEGDLIGRMIREELGLPVLEIEVPPVSDGVRPALTMRLEALVETARARRSS
ncbi:MAG: 2-hydroxyacyl-CoA dehydratase family protein [Phycisphaeraceae bacterium]